eukprot:scaffold166603_cov43-Attheya_sp.AAC.1
MAPSTPTTTPNVTPICSRLEDDNTRKRKTIATPPRPTPPRTGLPDRRNTYATTKHGLVANPTYYLPLEAAVENAVKAVGWVDL